jgi:hypothetical protein
LKKELESVKPEPVPKLGEEGLAEPIWPAGTLSQMAARRRGLARDFHGIDVVALKSPA